MKHKAIIVIMLCAILSLGFSAVPKVSSQTENVKVTSYGWYIDSLGYLVAVGEIQNIGSDIIDTVALSGIVYTLDGTAQASSYTQAYVNNMLPQQKAPFYMEFNPGSSSTSDLSWLAIGIDRVDFTINLANVTNNYQYPDLVIENSTGTVDLEGVCWVTGTVLNTGSQAATNVRIIGTFYNASGAAIATGYTDPKPSISPSGSASFKLGAFDLNQTEVPSSLKTSNYSLLIQAEAPILSVTPPAGAPSLPPAEIKPIITTSSDTPPSTNPPPTEPSDTNPDNPMPQEYLYVIAGVVVGLVLAVSAVVLRGRKVQANRRTKLQARKQQRAQNGRRKSN